MKLLKHLRHYWAAIIILVGLLCIRAYSELELPTYTSSIVNVGIQQNGIEDAVPNKLTKETYNNIQLFFTDEEKQVLQDSYQADGQFYTLKDIAKTVREQLNSTFAEVATLVSFLQKQGTNLASLSALPSEARQKMRTDTLTNLGEAKSMLTKQVGVAFVKQEYDKVGEDVEKIRSDYLWYAGSMMLLMTAIGGLVSIGTAFISSRIAAHIGHKLRAQVYEKVLAFSKNDIDHFSTASLITRTTNDIQQIQTSLGMILFMALYAPIMAIGGIMHVLDTNTSMSWIIALGIGVLLSIVITLMSLALPKFQKMQSLIDRVNLVSRELLTGLSVIRVFGREKYEEKRFDTESDNLLKTQLFTNRVMSFFMPSLMLIMNVLSILIIWVGGHQIDAGDMQVGDMMAFLNYTMLIVISFVMLTMLSIIIPRATVAAKRVDEVLVAPITVTDTAEPKDAELADVKGVVRFENVSFTFPGADEAVLTDISFEAQPGKTTAFIGSTGSGKSTLIHLLPRYFDVTEGRITIDGIDIRDISLHKLREIQGFVPQKGVLFSGTIESNIKYASDDITDEQMKEAASIAQATAFIEEKEHAYQSPIAQGGSNVSGGQKQRLSIARAIAKKPPILLFDDSFSALDYKTDVTLRAALQQAMSQATTLIVAQRIATILHADQIIVLDNGQIVGIGTHAELLVSCETYRQIAQSQLSEEELAKGGAANE